VWNTDPDFPMDVDLSPMDVDEVDLSWIDEFSETEMWETPIAPKQEGISKAMIIGLVVAWIISFAIWFVITILFI
jgi:hypothetical protein